MGLGFEIRDPEKTYSGFSGLKGTGSGSATLMEIYANYVLTYLCWNFSQLLN